MSTDETDSTEAWVTTFVTDDEVDLQELLNQFFSDARHNGGVTHLHGARVLALASGDGRRSSRSGSAVELHLSFLNSWPGSAGGQLAEALTAMGKTVVGEATIAVTGAGAAVRPEGWPVESELAGPAANMDERGRGPSW
jgi:hypothetical protein